MKLILVAASVVLVSGCAAPSHRVDANRLARDIRAVDGVADVDVRYDEPEALDSADVEFDVTMAPEAEPAAIVELFRVTYDGFSDEHEHEEGNLYVRSGGDTYSLRSFEPRATTEEVVAALEELQEVSLEYDADINVNTQVEERGPSVTVAARVRLPKGSSVELKQQTRTDLEVRYPEVRWDVLVRRR